MECPHLNQENLANKIQIHNWYKIAQYTCFSINMVKFKLLNLIATACIYNLLLTQYFKIPQFVCYRTRGILFYLTLKLTMLSFINRLSATNIAQSTVCCPLWQLHYPMVPMTMSPGVPYLGTSPPHTEPELAWDSFQPKDYYRNDISQYRNQTFQSSGSFCFCALASQYPPKPILLGLKLWGEREAFNSKQGEARSPMRMRSQRMTLGVSRRSQPSGFWAISATAFHMCTKSPS